MSRPTAPRTPAPPHAPRPAPHAAPPLAAPSPPTRHHPRRHAAARTDEYLYAQLIPYIGNKRKLLPLIAEGVAHTGLTRRGTTPGLFVDLFSGSTVVSRLAKTLGFRVLANDWEPYAHTLAHGTVAANVVPRFEKLGGAANVFDTLNALPPLDGYVSHHLCPADDDNPDPQRERLFFTRANGRCIDAMRERVLTWESEGLLGPVERDYILSALIYAVSYVSNTSGVFKGFHHGWGGRTGTALYRIRSQITLRMPPLFDNGQPNLATRLDAQQLAASLADAADQRPAIVYLDPPYNQHPYGSNYHVLNTVALWDKPPLHPLTRIDGRSVDKSAIRRDWRTQRRSAYNVSRQAGAALRTLVESLDAPWLMMSYSTDGNIPTRDALHTLASRGRLHVIARPYKRYRVSTPRMSPRARNVEFLAIVDTSRRGGAVDAERWAEAIEEMDAG